MLNIPSWDRGRKAPKMLNELIAFLEKKPANETYKYPYGDECLLSQFFTEKFGEKYAVNDAKYWEGTTAEYPKVIAKKLPKGFDTVARHKAGFLGWQTMGQALKNAQELKKVYETV